MRNIEMHCGLPEFGYDFDNVESQSNEADEILHFKMPHEGSGPVVDRNSRWDDILHPALAKWVIDQCPPLFRQTFGFG